MGLVAMKPAFAVSTKSGSEVKNFFHAQQSTKFQLLIKRQIKMFLALSLSDIVFIMLINKCWHFNIYEQDKFHAQLI